MNSRALVSARAFLLSRVVFGESDLVVHLFTDSFGKVAALARGARRSQKRFQGSLEPLHTLRVQIEERVHGDLWTLKESQLEQPRIHLVARLDKIECAGRALAWVRKASPPRTPEAMVWVALERLFDDLDHDGDGDESELRLIVFGLRLLDGLGFGLELTRCVSCGRPCREGQAAWVTPERGGIVCRACGGGPLLLSGPLRKWMLRVISGTEPEPLPEGRDTALRLLERAIEAHIVA